MVGGASECTGILIMNGIVNWVAGEKIEPDDDDLPTYSGNSEEIHTMRMRNFELKIISKSTQSGRIIAITGEDFNFF